MIQTQTIRSAISPKASKHESQLSNHSTLSNRSSHSSHSSHSSQSKESNEEHIREILDSAEKWITQQLLFHEYVTAFDLLEQFDVSPKLARMLITRFEKRTSTYAIYPLSMDSTIPSSSLQPLEQMLECNINAEQAILHDINPNLNIDFDPLDVLGAADDDEHITHLHTSNSFDSQQFHTDFDLLQSSGASTKKLSKSQPQLQAHDKLPAIKKSTKLFLEPTQSGDVPLISPSVSPRIYINPFDYIDYHRSNFDTWFAAQKHKYVIAIQESAAAFNIGLPENIADIIVINTILLPGCYTLTGLLFPAARNEADLFAEYANQENGYITNKTDKGIAYKRKKPMVNVRRPENNTASLWLDEDGSICGFRCIWVHGIRGKLMVDQKLCVLNGCWSLTGEITITFEQWDVEDEFEGSLQAETFCGRWTAGKEIYGEFQWFITTIESFYLSHNIPINDEIVGVDQNGNNIIQKTSLGFHDSMGVSMEDEFDLEDDIMLSPIANMTNGKVIGAPNVITKVTDPVTLLYNKIFDIEINESLTIQAKFLKQGNRLEISEKMQNAESHRSRRIGPSSVDAEFDDVDDDDDDEDEIIGYGQWYGNGKISFKDVKYLEQKLLLSFNGCCDGKKVLGRLCIYHDNTPNNTQKKAAKRTRSGRVAPINTDTLDMGDLDDDDEETDDLFGSGSSLHNDIGDDSEANDEEEEEEDDDDRISFIQMIIVSNIVPA